MQTFENNIINIYGKRGKEWLAQIPNTIDKLAKKYQLTQLQPVANMSYNYVAAGYKNNKPIILKLGLDFKALAKEASCLQTFSAVGAAHVFSSAEGILIIERAVPGETLKGYFPNKEDEAIKIVCSIIKKLHSVSIPANNSFYNVRDLLQVLNNDLDIPNEILLKARQLRDELLASTDKNILLHGDLHHDNILQNGDKWIVIDPKGFIGDPAYEVAAFIRNPIPELLMLNNPQSIIQHRIMRFSEILGLSKQRIIDWCFVQAVLAWAWTLEDNGDIAYFKKLTALFYKSHNWNG